MPPSGCDSVLAAQTRSACNAAIPAVSMARSPGSRSTRTSGPTVQQWQHSNCLPSRRPRMQSCTGRAMLRTLRLHACPECNHLGCQRPFLQGRPAIRIRAHPLHRRPALASTAAARCTRRVPTFADTPSVYNHGNFAGPFRPMVAFASPPTAEVPGTRA